MGGAILYNYRKKCQIVYITISDAHLVSWRHEPFDSLCLTIYAVALTKTAISKESIGLFDDTPTVT